MNWGAIGTILSVIALGFSAGIWYQGQNHEIYELNEKVNSLLSHVEKHPEPIKASYSIELSRVFGADHYSNNNEVFELGSHDACFITKTNETGGSGSSCYLFQEEKKWRLEVNRSVCHARCINLISD